MNNLHLAGRKRALEKKWKRIQRDFIKKYNLFNSHFMHFDGRFEALLEKLQAQTGIKKRELKREIRMWNMDISDSYNF